MPRPKKPGAPQPKKRSRNGCWPCKARKVKCDEAKPGCLNCQRQDEACDYSIRLNWDGRGKRKADDGQGGFTVGLSTNTPPTASKTPSDASMTTFHFTSQPASDRGVSPAQSQYQQNNGGQWRPSPIPRSSYTGYEHSFSSAEMTMIDPGLIGPGNSLQEGYRPARYDRHLDPNNTPYPESQERYPKDRSQSRTGSDDNPVFSPMTRISPSSGTFPGGLDSPSESGLESPSAGSFIEFAPNTTFDRTSKRIRLGLSQDQNSPGPMDMPPPHVSNTYLSGTHASPQTSTTTSSLTGIPLTPGASSQSDDAYKSFQTKASLYTPPENATSTPSDPRRLSVESLLSGPPGMPSTSNPHVAMTTSSKSYGDSREDMKTWGVDRGFKDLDIGKNDDLHAITGGSPTALREPLDIVREMDADFAPIEFGFGVQAKDTAFEKGGYYANPVPIKIPRSFEPLPQALLENPMNLLYFHHFMSHTARILVPHHCSSNPFQKVLPKMALQDSNLMNLLLAYSASHRARLLQQPEPATRIALWVQDIFPMLRHALDDPTKIVSNSNLAAAIMLASLEIISPKAFGIAVPWQQHLDVARQMIAARGGVKGMRDNKPGSLFLLRWFAYLDVLGRLTGGHTGTSSFRSTAYGDEEQDEDYQIDCLLGFSSRCITILAKVADLAAFCATDRLDEEHNVRPDWEPTEEIRQQAEKLIDDLAAARTSTKTQGCPNLQSAGEATYQWDNQEMAATNEAFHWAGLIHVHRRILGKPSTDKDVQAAVREIVRALYRVRKASSAEACLLFPMFTAGCDAQDEKQKALILDKMRGIEEFGMSQVNKAKRLMQKVWESRKPWETLVKGEFVG